MLLQDTHHDSRPSASWAKSIWDARPAGGASAIWLGTVPRSAPGIVRHLGAFAEFLTLPEANLRAVPACISDQHAVFTEPLAAAFQILDQVALPPGQIVAVLGDGKLGLLIAMTLLAHGLPVHHFGRPSG